MSPASRDGRPLVIELCGLPGAGKTTVAGDLVSCLADHGVAARVVDRHLSADVSRPLRLSRKATTLARVVAADPGREVAAARLLGSGQSNRRDTIALPVQWWVAKDVLARSRLLTGVAVAEEGLVQALWSAGLRGRRGSPDELVCLAQTAAAPDVVVHLDVPVQVALHRLRTRRSRHSRVQRLDEHEQAAALGLGDTLLRELLEQWRSRQLSQVLTVDGESSRIGAHLASTVIDLLGSIDSPPPPREDADVHPTST